MIEIGKIYFSTSFLSLFNSEKDYWSSGFISEKQFFIVLCFHRDKNSSLNSGLYWFKILLWDGSIKWIFALHTSLVLLTDEIL